MAPLILLLDLYEKTCVSNQRRVAVCKLLVCVFSCFLPIVRVVLVWLNRFHNGQLNAEEDACVMCRVPNVCGNGLMTGAVDGAITMLVTTSLSTTPTLLVKTPSSECSSN